MRGNKTSIRRLNVCQKKMLITGNRRQKQQNGGGMEGRGGRANLPCGEVFFVYVVYFFQGIQANVPSLSRVRWSISSQRVAANAVAIPHPSLGPLGRNLKKVFHSSSEARNHSCKELHGLSVFHFHFHFNLLFLANSSVKHTGGNNSCQQVGIQGKTNKTTAYLTRFFHEVL